MDSVTFAIELRNGPLKITSLLLAKVGMQSLHYLREGALVYKQVYKQHGLCVVNSGLGTRLVSKLPTLPKYTAELKGVFLSKQGAPV